MACGEIAWQAERPFSGLVPRYLTTGHGTRPERRPPRPRAAGGDIRTSASSSRCTPAEGLSVVSRATETKRWARRGPKLRPHRARLMLPGLDGARFAAPPARLAHADVPILMLTARRDEVARCRPRSGADDYLTKPFGVRGWWNGPGAAAPPRPDRRACAAVQAGAAVEPAAAGAADEREIADRARSTCSTFMATTAGIVSSRDALVQRVWGEEAHHGPERGPLVKRLRRKD